MICFIPRKDWSIPFTKPFMHICTSFNSFIQNFYSSPRLTNTSCMVKDVDTPYIPRINIHSLMFQRNISLLLLLHILRSFHVRKNNYHSTPTHIFYHISFIFRTGNAKDVPWTLYKVGCIHKVECIISAAGIKSW